MINDQPQGSTPVPQQATTTKAFFVQNAFPNSSPEFDRQHAVTRGRWLEYFTIGYNTLEGLIAIVAGLIAGSIALVRFGVDSLIEVTSGAALLWRLRADVDESRRERVEALTLRIVGVCFLTLAVYVFYDSVTALLHREPPDPSLIGIILAAVSLIVMPPFLLICQLPSPLPNRGAEAYPSVACQPKG